MKKKNRIWIYPLIIMGFALIVLINSCEKDDNINPTDGKTTAVFNSNLTYGTMTDQDGNVYKTITIDTQTWMAENLRTTKYNDGTTIPNITDNEIWDSLTTGAFCTYNNTTDAVLIATYGNLYNWYTVNTGKLCPTGWHVPTRVEWTILTNYFGSRYEAACKLKEADTTHWTTYIPGGNNSSGFTALPGGLRNKNGTFKNIGDIGNWWSSTENTTTDAWGCDMSVNVFIDHGNKKLGLSVRCLRDN